MRKRWFTPLAVLAFLVLACPARAADAQPETPTVVIRVQAIDELLADAKFLANLVDREDQAKQLEGLLKSFIGEKGLEGIDTSRPLGAYGYLASDAINSSAIAMIPIRDEKAVLDLLERLDFKAQKGNDGIYTIASSAQVPVDVYFRFADGYAYVTARYKEAIAKDKLLPASRILPAGQVGTFSLNMRIDQIPKTLREIGLAEFERRVKDSGPLQGKTDAQRKLEEQLRNELVAEVATIINDGEEIQLRVNLDRQKKDLVFETKLTGKPGSKLASAIAELGQGQSLFSSLPAKNSAAAALAHVVLPESIRKAMAPALDEVMSQGLTNIPDPKARALAEKLFHSVMPTLKAGELDAELDLRGPDQQLYTVVAAVKLRDGLDIEKALRDAVVLIPEKERARVHLDAEILAGLTVHRLDVLKELDPDVRAVFGEGPVYLAIRKDAAFVAAGPQALAGLKAALAAPPGPVQSLRVEVAMAALAPLLKDQKSAPEIARKVFAQEPEGDKLRITVQGGKALEARFTMKTPLIRFFAEVGGMDAKGK